MANWYCVTDFSHIVPRKPGCYAIYALNAETFKKKLLYIGTARNLSLRLARHEVRRVLFALLDWPELVYIKCREIDSGRLLLEKKLIKKLKPKANQ